ncbi:MAG: hypothetical protein DRJ35_02890 [Thermoprotei archaeon]|nr:MAG: hypothetical protein DRJ35_02890 [Thermoprotei archaeon]
MNLMKRTLFGVPMGVLVASLLSTVALGAVVNLISNTIQLTVETKTPLEVKFTDVSNRLTIVDDNTATGTIYAGDTFWFKYNVTNHANNPIDRYPVILTKSDAGLSAGLQEVERIIYYDANYPSGIDITNMVYCVNNDGSLTQLRNCPATAADTWLELFFDNNGDGTAQPYTITAETTWWYKIEVETSPSMAEQNVTIKYEEHFSLP